MLYWLPAVALALAVVYLWGGTPFWLDYQWCHWGWDWVLYAVLVAVPLIVIGILATRQQLSNTPPPPQTHRGWRLATVYLALLAVWTLTAITADFNAPSFDFTDCLWPWTQSYAEHGLWWSLRHFTEVSNYTAFYNYFLIILGQCHPTQLAALYAIKYLTYLASVATGVTVALIVAHVRKRPLNWWLVMICLALPPVWEEFATWGQCDAIYVALCLFAFYAALKHRSQTCMVLVGLAFAMKFQFIFIVPVLFIMLIVKDDTGRHYLRWRDLWLAPAMYVVNILPVCFGAPFWPLVSVYFVQSTATDWYLSANCASLPGLTEIIVDCCLGLSPSEITYRLLPFHSTEPFRHGLYYGHLVLGLIAFGVLLWAVVRRCLRNRPTATDLCYYALLFALTMPFVMPHMHDRFLFLTAVLAVLYVAVEPGRRNYWVAALIVGSLTIVMFDSGWNLITGVGRIWALTVAILMNLVAWVWLLLPLNRSYARRKITLPDTAVTVSPTANTNLE